MIETAPTVEPLDDHHDRAAFSCGVEALDRYLRQQAGQDQRRNVATVFVALGEKPGKVAGFYTLSSFTIEADEIPKEVAKKLPRYGGIPAALIGRLAVHSDFQRQHLGKFLLLDALAKVIEASKTIAVWAVVVEAKDESAASFYERYGFRKFPTRPHRLFLPVETARQVFSGQGG